MKGLAITYSDAELAFLKDHETMPRRELQARFNAKFGRDISVTNIKAKCTRMGLKTGRTGCFSPGQTSWNKGKKMPYNANSARTQFKKGQTPHNTKYLGHERISKDGYVEISVDEVNPHTGFERRYVLKHRYLWEQKHGPVPDGYCLKSRDGNRQNTDPDNWKAIPRALLPRLGGRFGRNYDAAPAELKPTIMAIAEVEHGAQELGKHKGANS